MKTISKIMIVMPDFGLGGTQRVVSILLAEWVRQYQLCLVTLADKNSDFYSFPSEVERIGLNLTQESGSLLRAVKANYNRIINLRRLIKQKKPDVIISFLESTNVLSVFAKLGLGKRLVLCVRADPSKRPLNLAWSLLQKSLYRFANHITANNREAVTWLTQYVNESKLSYIPNPVRLKQVKPKLKQKIILAVGRLHYEKGSEVLLRSFFQSQLYHKGWQLTFVGDGPLESHLKQLVQQFDLTNYVNFAGRISVVDPYYQHASMFVLPSRHEGMPNALLEALSYGLPVIVSDSLAEPLAYVGEGRCGISFESENIDSLACALSTLAADSDFRNQLVANRELTLKQNKLSSVLACWQSVIEGDIVNA